jgi:endonuclease/exonuclease/phosphatase family metal-dependent hydrolase
MRWLYHIFGHHQAPATFPVRRPWFALDRIWVKPKTMIEDVYAYRSDMALLASDHLPLVTDLNIQ